MCLSDVMLILTVGVFVICIPFFLPTRASESVLNGMMFPGECGAETEACRGTQ